MNRLLVVLTVLVALEGCSDPRAEAVERAKRRVAIIEQARGSGEEICEAKRAVATALLDAERAGEYQSYKLSTDIFCQNVKLDRDIQAL